MGGVWLARVCVTAGAERGFGSVATEKAAAPRGERAEQRVVRAQLLLWAKRLKPPLALVPRPAGNVKRGGLAEGR